MATPMRLCAYTHNARVAYPMALPTHTPTPACLPLHAPCPMGTPYPTHPWAWPATGPHTWGYTCTYAHTRITPGLPMGMATHMHIHNAIVIHASHRPGSRTSIAASININNARQMLPH